MEARSKIRKAATAAMVIVLLYFLFYSYVGLSQGTMAVVKSANWGFLSLAVAFQISYLFFSVWLYKYCFKIYQIDWSLPDFLKLFLASIFTSLISLVGGALAGGLFLRKAKREDIPAAHVINALFLENLADLAALFIFVIVGIIFLVAGRDIYGYEIAGFIAFALLVSALVFVLAVGNFRPGLLTKFFRMVRAIANKTAKIFRSDFNLPESWPQEKCREFADVSKRFTKNKIALIKIAVISILAHAANALTLFFCFLSFGYQAEWEAVVAGYGMGMLFATISITPQGLGVVDGVISAIFVSFGAMLKVAILAVFTFRLLSFWLPALAGFLTFNRIRHSFPR